jgi:hypothetical protein
MTVWQQQTIAIVTVASSFFAAVLMAFSLSSNAFAATVEIPTFTEEEGLGLMATNTQAFDYPDGQKVVEIPFKDTKVKINVDEYNKCVDEQEKQMTELTKDVPGGGAFLAGGRLDAMSTCIDFNSAK